MAKRKADSEMTQISIPAPEWQSVTLGVVGETPYLAHRMSEDAKEQMRIKQQKKAKVEKKAKDPERRFQESQYVLGNNGERGIPVDAFYKAIVDAVSLIEGLTKTRIKLAFKIQADGIDQDGRRCVKVDYGEVVCREDPATVGGYGGTRDLRYRAEFRDWSVVLRMQFCMQLVSAEQFVNLVNWAGLGGVGDWRPSSPKGGTHGVFHVDVGGTQ